MTKAHLVELLEEYEDHQEVLIMHQPDYPLVEVPVGVTDDQMLGLDPDEQDEESDDLDDRIAAAEAKALEDRGAIYIVVGGPPNGRSPYGRKDAWDHCAR